MDLMDLLYFFFNINVCVLVILSSNEHSIESFMHFIIFQNDNNQKWHFSQFNWHFSPIFPLQFFYYLCSVCINLYHKKWMDLFCSPLFLSFLNKGHCFMPCILYERMRIQQADKVSWIFPLFFVSKKKLFFKTKNQLFLIIFLFSIHSTSFSYCQIRRCWKWTKNSSGLYHADIYRPPFFHPEKKYI